MTFTAFAKIVIGEAKQQHKGEEIVSYNVLFDRAGKDGEEINTLSEKSLLKLTKMVDDTLAPYLFGRHGNCASFGNRDDLASVEIQPCVLDDVLFGDALCICEEMME